MRSRFIRVFFFTLALSLLALSCCAFACADSTDICQTPAGVGGFTVEGVIGDHSYPATDEGTGFRSYLRVADGEPVLLAAGDQFAFDQSYGTSDVAVSISAESGYNGRAVIVTYTITNLTDTSLPVRVGSCARLQPALSAQLLQRGVGLVSQSGGLCFQAFPGTYAFSSVWCGSLGSPGGELFYRDSDCTASWYWFMQLDEHHTSIRQVVIALGDQTPCSVILDPNGGVFRNTVSGGRQERLAILGSDFALPPTPFERGGYRFLGWAREEDAETPDYTSVIPQGDLCDGMELYAVWQDKTLQPIDADDLVIDYGDSASLSVSGNDGRLSYAVKAGGDVISVDSGSGAITTWKTGTATVTVTAAATNDFNETSVDVGVTVRPKELIASMLTLSPDTLPYTGQPQTPGASVQQNGKPLALGTDYEFDDTSVRTAIELGEYRITINGLGNYSGSTSAVWKIAKRTPAVQLSAYSGTYDGAAHPLVTVDTHTGGTLEFGMDQDGPWSAAIPEAAAAGSHTVWYRVVGDEFWLDAAPASCTAEITRKAVTVSGITAADKLYDASSSAELVLGGARLEGVCPNDNVVLHSAAGQFSDADAGQNKRVSISAITLGGSDAGNYTLAAGQQTEAAASITRRPITIRAKDQSIPLYGSIVQGAGQVSVDGLCSFDTLRSVFLSIPSSLSPAGKGSITPGQAVIVRSGSTQDVTKNYAIAYEAGELTAEQREVTLSWSDTEFVYDGKSHVPTATVSGTQYGEVLTVRVSGSKIAANPEDGEYIATAVGLSGTNAVFYKLPEEATHSFVIKPRSLEQDAVTVEYRPDDEVAVIGPVPNDGRSYGFKSIAVYDGTRKLVKDVDYTLDSHYSTIYGPHTLHIIGKGNYEGCLARDWTMIGNGLVSAAVDVKNGAASVYWNNASEDLAERLLDDEDREVRDEYGTPTDVLLAIRPAVIPSGISAKAGQIGESVAVSYDLSLVKRIGNEPEVIRDTGGIPISVTLDIPQELRKAPLGYYRSFSLIHLHNGTAEVIAQGTGTSFTFTTTSFSAYAISYRDIKLPPTASPPTGDTAHLPLWSVLLLFSGCGLLCLVRKKREV